MDGKKNSPKQKMTHRQAAAITGVVLLVLLYVVTFIVAILDNSDSSRWFYIFLFATFAVPLLTWIYIWIYGRMTGKPAVGDPADSQDGKAREASPGQRTDMSDGETVKK